MKPVTSALILIATTATTLLAADWPQYRGPNRDDVSAETNLLKQWPPAGPQLLWTYPNAGVGYSGPAIVGDRLYTLGDRGDSAFLIALDLKTFNNGAPSEIWAARIGPNFDWQKNVWSAGPSATPTVDGNLIFALGGTGDLLCADANTGKELWRKNLPTDLEAQINPIGGGPKNLGWGFTWSPLVDGDQLICIPGGPKGAVAALDKKTGALLWRTADLKDQAAYTSPIPATIHGVRQYLVLTNQTLAGISTTGQLLWSHKRARPYGTEVINSPIIKGNLVFTSVGANQGTDCYRVSKNDAGQFAVTPVYNTPKLGNHHGNLVLVNDHVFGHNGAGWACQTLATGDIVWSDRKLPPGAVTFADGKLYCFTENDGTTALVDAVPTGYKESGRFKLPKLSTLRKKQGKLWTPPVIANGKLYLRDQDLIFCYDVTAK